MGPFLWKQTVEVTGPTGVESKILAFSTDNENCQS